MSCLRKCIQVRSYCLFDRLCRIAQLASPSNLKPLPPPGVDGGGIGGLPLRRYRGASSGQSRRRWVARRRRRTIPTIVTPNLANEEVQVSHIPTIISKRPDQPPLDSLRQPPRYTTGAHRPLLPQVQRYDVLPTINRGLLRRTDLRRRQHCTSSTQPASQSLTLCKIYMLT